MIVVVDLTSNIPSWLLRYANLSEQIHIKGLSHSPLFILNISRSWLTTSNGADVSLSLDHPRQC